MKIVIFAGGTGRRLWPISRKQTPKQFEPILGEQSTVQLAVERVQEPYGAENVFVSTNRRYEEIIRRQLPDLPPENIIGEPERRDLAPAVGLAMAHLAHHNEDPDEPVAILWGDNVMSDVETFRALLATGEQLIRDTLAEIVFIGETPRFPNENLGWIGLGEERGAIRGCPYFAFDSFVYRPPMAAAQQMFAGRRHVWNTGYFLTTARFIRDLYARFQPEMFAGLEAIKNTIGAPDYDAVLQEQYPRLARISFDDAILTHVAPHQAVVLHGEMGWSDPGTLYALKEALAEDQAETVTQGLVLAQDTRDSLLFNYEGEKLMAVIGLEGIVVVNTDDALLVVHKDMIPRVKELVNSLEGTELEKYS
ncbi:MAG: mannose-1-phosphate guanylyltransferase [Chloroflexi bacterium]|nr:mannose-1-phosphate guanylyltransferase [Chloroflexota bacterium]